MNRYTQIICTLGPSSSNIEMIKKMTIRGMNVARINLSHGNAQQHQKLIDLVRDVNKKFGFNVRILIDLEGYRIRIGTFKKTIHLEKNKKYSVSNEPYQGGDHIPIDYGGELSSIMIKSPPDRVRPR